MLIFNLYFLSSLDNNSIPCFSFCARNGDSIAKKWAEGDRDRGDIGDNGDGGDVETAKD